MCHKPTARVEVAVAETLKSASPKVLVESAPKLIVWAAFCALTVSVTWFAAL